MSKTWLITHTSSGLGRQLTEQLLARGDRVAATLRKPSAPDVLKAKCGDALWTGCAGVTDATGLRTTVDAAFAEMGRIDIVVSNAGCGAIGALEQFTDEQVEGQIATNFTGSAQLVRAVIPHLRARRAAAISSKSLPRSARPPRPPPRLVRPPNGRSKGSPRAWLWRSASSGSR